MGGLHFSEKKVEGVNERRKKRLGGRNRRTGGREVKLIRQGKINYLIRKIIKGKMKCQEDIVILNTYVSNTRALKFVKNILEKKIIYCPQTLNGRDFNTSLLQMYRLSRQKLIEKC